MSILIIILVIGIVISIQRRLPKDNCNHDCNQGRDCPIRKEMRKRPIEFWKIWHNFLYSTNFTLMEWLVMLAVGILIGYNILK